MGIEALALVLTVALSAPKAEANEAAARVAATEAKTAFEANNFALALEKYGQAYQLKQAPRLLFNVAQCHRQLGHHDQAISFYQRYLDSSPPEDQAQATRELIADERAKLDQQRSTAQQQRQLELEKARTASAQAEAEVARRRMEELKQRRELESLIKDAPAPPPPPPPPAFYERGWFWGAVGVVVVGGVVAAIAVSNAPKPNPTSFPDIHAR